MESAALDYRMYGEAIQVVEVVLDPGETVVAEPGAMIYMDDDIAFKAKVGTGSKGRFLSKTVGRVVSGEGLFLTHFTNESPYRGHVAFASSTPGKIVPLELWKTKPVVCQKNAFLCAARGTSISVHFNKRLGSVLFGGAPFVLQKLSGDGIAFVNAGGAVLERYLTGGTLRVDVACLLAFEETIEYSIGLVKGLTALAYGGEGMFLATLRGEGKVWIQSLPHARMVFNPPDMS